VRGLLAHDAPSSGLRPLSPPLTGEKGPQRRSSLIYLAVCNALLIAVALHTGGLAFAQEESAPPAVNESVAAPDAPIPPDVPDEREKRRTALAGLAAVAGIAIIGVALGALIILWAGRLRRINREPLPRTCAQNEYWFLKPPKPPVSEKGVEGEE
jgi:hypothetical protein